MMLKWNFILQIRGVRNLIMHSSNLSVSETDFNTYITQMKKFLTTVYSPGILGRTTMGKEKLALDHIKQVYKQMSVHQEIIFYFS